MKISLLLGVPALPHQLQEVDLPLWAVLFSAPSAKRPDSKATLIERKLCEGKSTYNPIEQNLTYIFIIYWTLVQLTLFKMRSSLKLLHSVFIWVLPDVELLVAG